MITVEILKAAKALIADPECWTQGQFALNSSGTAVHGYTATACRWCALGALQHETRLLSVIDSEPGEALYSAALSTHGLSVAQLNDHLDHAAVMEMYDKAIELAEAEI